MCGLVGVASRKSINDRNWLINASKTLTHRGPDDNGEWWSKDNKVGMAHRRLSIVDLSSSAHQPMQNYLSFLMVKFITTVNLDNNLNYLVIRFILKVTRKFFW